MIALARKYRPRRFAELLVQDHVAAALRGAVAKGRVGHGYLLTGPRGTGKTTAARILAMALNCERRKAESGEPCGECASCQRIWSGGANLDVVEIDAASNRGVDDARELRERAMYAASQEGRHKVYIVDEAHMLTREAWNALLKILEEPPPGVVFVFATTEPQKIAATAAPVLSRLQRFDFRRIGPGPIRARLQQVLTAEGLSADPDALALIARYADGGMRDALSVLDQCLSFGEGSIGANDVRQVLGLVGDDVYTEVLRLVADRDTAAVFPLIERLVNEGADLVEVMAGTADVLRALLMAQTGVEPEGLTEALREAIGRARGTLAAGDVVRMLTLLAEAEASIRRSAAARIVVETLLLRWTVMDRLVDLEEMLRSGALATGSSGAGPGSRGPSSPEPDRHQSAPPVRSEGSRDPSAVGPPGRLAVTLDAVRAAWPELIAAVRERSALTAEAMAATLPSALDRDELVLQAGPEQAIQVEGVSRQRALIEEVLVSKLKSPVRIRVAVGASQGPPAEPAKRVTKNDLQAEKLARLRRLDKALDIAADALDLEIVDEGPASRAP
ncbi:MAG: DNA polymerase III subunit gamma/tau [Gemmatimonadales bacterium]